MDLAGEPTSTDEYFLTAHQIFECCGIESDSTLRVDSLMDKFTPFVKANNAEFSFLKSLLDPDQCNPEINATKLASVLHQYSEKSKIDLDESFNLRCGQAPQDSDSGISTDGLQLVEEDLQCKLKEKDRLAQQLRSQLDYSDRQHEEITATLTAERDSLKRHLNMLREENASLSHVRRDYDEACERLVASAAALGDARRELEALRRRARTASEQVASLEADKLSLQELLSKSKDECHRINEMYAARQSALLGESETLAGQRAELAARLRDQDEFMKQLLKEKLLLEMELKDTLNKSNYSQQRLDRSVDVSYTEDQMLTALDSLNADSRFSTENRILDEDSFINALKEDQGRSTNMSLFDEIRMSFNMSRMNFTEFNTAHCSKCSLDNSIVTSATQTEFGSCGDDYKNDNSLTELKTLSTTETQTELNTVDNKDENCMMIATGIQTDSEIQPCIHKNKVQTTETQTDENITFNVDKVVKVMTDFEVQTDIDITKVVIQNTLGIQTDEANKFGLYSGGDNAQNHCCVRKLDFETSFQDKPYGSENNVQFLDAKDYIDTGTQTVGEFIRKRPKFVKKAQKLLKLKQDKIIDKHRNAETQTDEIEPCVNNNNAHCVKCFECNNTYTVSEYENNLNYLEKLIGQGKERNEKQQALVDHLRSKIEFLESSCEAQRDAINKIAFADKSCVQSQTKFEITSVSTQADAPCPDCQRRAPHRSFRRFFWWVHLLVLITFVCALDRVQQWTGRRKRDVSGVCDYREPLKCLFQLFAVVCFLGAVSLLYGVSQRGRVRCDREPGATPWRWFDAQDIMDLLLRIEYTSEVPM